MAIAWLLEMSSERSCRIEAEKRAIVWRDGVRRYEDICQLRTETDRGEMESC